MALSHHVFEISRGSGSCLMQQFWVAALVFCCLAVRLQTGLFLIRHNRAPREDKTICFMVSCEDKTREDKTTCFVVSCVLILSFPRETPCQKVSSCKQAQTSRCLETQLQAEPGYWTSCVLIIVREVSFFTTRGVGAGSWNWIEIHKNELSPPPNKRH